MKSGDSDRLGQLVEEGIDCYAILGLPSGTPNLTSTVIRNQYNKLMREETDRSKIDALNDAFSILRDPDLREKHDNALGHDKLNASIKVSAMYEGIGTQNQTRTGEAIDEKQAKIEHLEKKAGIHAKMAMSGKYKQFEFIKHAEEAAKISPKDKQAASPQKPFKTYNKLLTKMEAEAARARTRQARTKQARNAAKRSKSTGYIDESAKPNGGRTQSDEKVDYVSLIKAERNEHQKNMAEKAEKSSLRTWFTGRNKNGLTKNEQAALKILQQNTSRNVKDVLTEVRNKKSGRSM